MERDIARHAGADRDREVDVGKRCNMLLPDHTGDLSALLGRKLRTGAGLSDRGCLLIRRLAAFLHAALRYLRGLRPSCCCDLRGLHDLRISAIFRPFSPSYALAAFGLHAVPLFAAADFFIRYVDYCSPSSALLFDPFALGGVFLRGFFLALGRPSFRPGRAGSGRPGPFHRGSSASPTRLRRLRTMARFAGPWNRRRVSRGSFPFLAALRPALASRDPARWRRPGNRENDLSLRCLLTCLHCPRRQRHAMGDVPGDRGFHRICFVNAR